MGQIDFNYSVPHALEAVAKMDFEKMGTLGRIYEIAQPLLLLYKPFGSFAQKIDSLVAIFILADSLEKNDKHLKLKIAIIAAQTASFALLVISPTLQAVTNRSIKVGIRLFHVYHHDSSLNTRPIILLGALREIIYIAAIACAGPQILAISMISQGCFEFYKSYRSFSKENKNRWDYMEGGMNVALAALRFKAAASLFTPIPNDEKKVDLPEKKNSDAQVQEKQLPTIEEKFKGVEVIENTIKFDNEQMKGKLEPDVIAEYKDRIFDSIFVGYKKMYLGVILRNIVENFQPPKLLDLDLFYGFENLEENEFSIRRIFSIWKDKGIDVIFRCNHIVLRKFKL